VPLSVTTKTGYLTSEDFVFDDRGSVVGVDENGNVVRRSPDLTTKLIAADVASETSGTRYLPNGELILATGTDGRILRITPDGTVETLASGLAYPNGIDVDRAGLIYIAEQAAGRLVTLDPVTRELKTLATDIFNANGVALSPDETKIFVGSFGGGVVYEVDNNARSRGAAKIFAKTPGSPGVPVSLFRCSDLEVGAACFGPQGEAGQCEDRDGQRQCTLIDSCHGRAQGDACAAIWGQNGVCVAGASGLELTCAVESGCASAKVGDICSSWFGPATCELVQGVKTCVEKACNGVAIEGQCENLDGSAGTCLTFEDSPIVCYTEEAACSGQDEGSPCADSFGIQGKCAVFEGEDDITLWCEVMPGCETLEIGETCIDEEERLGTCQEIAGTKSCNRDVGCEGASEGERCAYDRNQIGECTLDGDAMRCELPVSVDATCEGHLVGTACFVEQRAGVCTVDGETVRCETTNSHLQDACTGRNENDACEVGRGELLLKGTCQNFGGDGEESLDLPFAARLRSEGLICDVYDPSLACQAKTSGDSCLLPQWGGLVADGVCKDQEGTLNCVSTGDENAGGLDGINVDACGNVYVTEYVLGKVWRIRSDGSAVEEAASLPSSWIPNMHWGSGIGEWDRNTLYVSDRDEGRLFGISVGLPGVPEVYP
jgi:sugar lactone lactonase YvrE